MQATMHAFQNRDISYLDLVTQLSQLYAEGRAGTSVHKSRHLARCFVSLDQHNLYSYTFPIFRYFRRLGLPIIVVSGAPQEILEAYQVYLGPYKSYGICVEHRGGIYTGAATANSALPDVKGTIVRLLERKCRISIAIGDTVADKPMLEAARIGILIADQMANQEADFGKFADSIIRASRFQLLSLVMNRIS